MNQPDLAAEQAANDRRVAQGVRRLHVLAGQPAPGPGHVTQECEVCQALAVACVDYALTFVTRLAHGRPLLAELLQPAMVQEFGA